MPKSKWQVPIEQGLHFLMGFGLRLVFADYFWYWRERTQQWPPGESHLVWFENPHMQGAIGKTYQPLDRVEDLMTDIQFYVIGGQVADVVRAGLVLWWGLS